MERWQVAPTLGVRSVSEAVSYFCERLGFESPSLHGPVEAPVYAIVHRDAIAVHLQIRRHEVFVTPRESHEGDAYFFVPDVDALRAELGDRGVTIFRDLLDEPYGL